MRVGYEFDSSENNYKVNSYVAAFRHIVETFRDMKVDNVAFVWHSYAQVQEECVHGSICVYWYTVRCV